jgi:hypothetical protein
MLFSLLLLARWWVIGDSNGWLLMGELRKLAKQHDVVLDGNPVGGTSIPWWAGSRGRSNLAAMAVFKPEVVIAILGTNDAYLGPYLIAKMPVQLTSLQTYITNTGAKLVWVGPPKLLPRLNHNTELVLALVTSAGIPLLDSRECTFDMWDDHIHPTESGRVVWASWIWEGVTAEITNYSAH